MDDRFLEDLKSRTDIVDIVRRYSELKKRGKNYMCCSPFRNERTPSFCVSPDKQFWYDFGTAEGGDVISFLERIENLNFQEAVEMLSDMAGMEIPDSFGKGKGPSKEIKKDIYTLHQVASEYFQNQLRRYPLPDEYLQKRGIDREIQEKWALGYGGEISDGLTKHLLKEGFSHNLIAQSGVAFELEFGSKAMKDRFSERIIIPIREPREGKIVAFSGRYLGTEKKVAKYINSPENPVYNKSATLFGLYEGKKSIRDQDQVIAVEGYFDVISAHKAGINHSVATCGTALTEEHMRMLKRQTQKVYLGFDNDVAGKKATLRGVELCLLAEINPFIIDIQGGKDFDDMVREDPKTLQKAIQEAQNAVLFLLDRFAKKYLDGSSEGEKKYLDAIFYFVKLFKRPVEIDHFLEKIAHKINRNKSLIEEEFKRFYREETRYKKPKVTETSSQKITREQAFVGFLSTHWDFFGSQSLDLRLVEILREEAPRLILEKKVLNTPLEEDEKKHLMSWELDQELLYEENTSVERLKKDFQLFVGILKKEKEKEERRFSAQKIKEQMQSQKPLEKESELASSENEVY